ncbi:MAG: ribonuclease P protein component [Alphaproteobacteria bacterium]|nr:ribonuclease P protein component [Alphaproteobacteria bacterium]
MKRKTILNHLDFLTKYDAPKNVTPFFIVKIKPVKDINNPRYGIIASKRTFKLAVHRNRAKRLLRDWIAFHENLMIDKYDYVFIARADILSATRDKGRDFIKQAFTYFIDNDKKI